MEELLDKIEEGKLDWIVALREFQDKFTKDLERAKVEMRDVKREAIPTDQSCDKCGKMMVLKWGRFGQFLACSGYPDCKNTRDLATDIEIDSGDRSDMKAAAKTAKIKTAPSQVEVEADPCEKCGKAMVLRRGRYGPFLACSSYPDCKNTRKVTTNKDGKAEAKADRLLDEECPKCGSKLAVKQGRYGEFTACSSYPKCRFVKMKETGVACPECADGKVVERRSKRGKLFYGCSAFPDCNFVTWKKPVDKKCPECGASYLVERITKKAGRQFLCDSENCDYSESDDE
jgi:DNA topoisomerase-1